MRERLFQLEISFSVPFPKATDSLQEKLEALLFDIEQEPIPALPFVPTTISLVFVSDEEMRILNKTYRKKDSSTDVLSFQLEDREFSAHSSGIFGEIYISVPTAERQAKEHFHSLWKEVNTLFVHGVLHLLGYDHENDSDFEKMHALEKKILKSRKSEV